MSKWKRYFIIGMEGHIMYSHSDRFTAINKAMDYINKGIDVMVYDGSTGVKIFG